MVGEYRYQNINYPRSRRRQGQGFEFCANRNLITRWGRKSPVRSHRVGGAESSGESSTSSPYAEATFRYSYSDQSFVSGGYTHSLEETDDPQHYTDSENQSLLY